MFSTLSEKNCTIEATLKLLSADAYNLDKAEILSSGEVFFNLFPNDKF